VELADAPLLAGDRHLPFHWYGSISRKVLQSARAQLISNTPLLPFELSIRRSRVLYHVLYVWSRHPRRRRALLRLLDCNLLERYLCRVPGPDHVVLYHPVRFRPLTVNAHASSKMNG